jgi:hypothetical protein
VVDVDNGVDRDAVANAPDVADVPNVIRSFRASDRRPSPGAPRHPKVTPSSGDLPGMRGRCARASAVGFRRPPSGSARGGGAIPRGDGVSHHHPEAPGSGPRYSTRRRAHAPLKIAAGLRNLGRAALSILGVDAVLRGARRER